MGAMEPPRYVEPAAGFQPTRPMFVAMVPPSPLPWDVRHPHLATVLVAAVIGVPAFVLILALTERF